MKPSILKALPPLRPRNEDPVDVSPMDRRVDGTWFTRSRLAAIAISVAVAATAIFGYVKYGIARTLTVNRDRVVVSEVTSGSFHDYIPVTGNVQPRETVYLDAVDGGQVAEV